MNTVIRVTLMVATVAAVGCQSTPRGKLPYPKTTQLEVVDDYHGIKVADPFRWLEDLDSPQTRKWVEAQNRLTFAYLAKLPMRKYFAHRLRELWNYERFSTPFSRGGRIFYFYNPGLKPQSVLYVTEDVHKPGRVLLDPNLLSKDGTVAVSRVVPSFDGSYLAYSTSEAGSDWQTWRVRRIDTGEDLTDTIKWTKFTSVAWLPDSSGFFYSQFDAPEPGKEKVATNYNQKLFFHTLGTSQEQDTLIYARPDQPEWEFSPAVTDDGRFLVITIHVGTDRRNRLYYKDLSQPQGEIKALLNDFDASYTFVDNEGDNFFIHTDKDAPKGRVVAFAVQDPSSWTTVIPERDQTLQSVSRVGNTLFARYLKHATTEVLAFDLLGNLRGQVQLPELGTATGFGGSRLDKESFYTFNSFLTPGTVYKLDVTSLTSEVIFAPNVPETLKNYVTEQVFVTSADGTKVPMFLTYRRGLPRNGKNPTILYGYGGFNIAITPSYSPRTVAWLERGGIWAVANLRGGSEYGEAWHQAGMLANKQNVFDDFLACAQWLQTNGYTSAKKLAIHGASNGGLLVGAAMTQRPDLFAVALPAVGVMDMLRFHKFTIGWAWVSEYGSSDDPQMFPILLRYSPLHNIKDGVCYPATLVTTADHDDRVVPSHSFKFAAKLQQAQGCGKLALIRIETRAGHGAGKPTDKLIEEAADMLAFVAANVGMR